MISTVFLCLLASTAASPRGILSSFKNAYGVERVSSHADSDAELLHAVQKQWQIVESDAAADAKSTHHYLACSSVSSAESLLSLLSAHVDRSSYHILLHSVQMDSTCYNFEGTLKDVSTISLSGKGVLSALHPVPASLKIHPSSLYAVDLADASVERDSVSAPPLFRMMKKNLDFEHSDLRVEFSSPSFDRNGAEASIRSKLVRDKHVGLEKLAEFRSSSASRNLWSEVHASSRALSAVESLRGQERCSYSSLEFAEGPSTLSVRGLHRVVGSALGRACLANLVATLALEPNVVNVYVRGHDKILNDVEKSIVQALSSSSGDHPYLDAGLNGTGQIVGVGDTGLDDKHCMFINSDSSSVDRSSVTNPQVDNTNRKVIQYISYANGGDTTNGHGSHVAGTIAGYDESESLDAFKGHASGAKLTFFDMSIDGNSIYYPTPISNWVFKPTYNAGGRLHSNSWGSYGNQYDAECRDIDQYHYDKDEFLVLFAAGNDGDDGFYSIASPATSKNSVAVGASKTTGGIDDLAYFSSMGPTFDNRLKPDVVAPGYFTTSAAARTSGESCSVVNKAGTSMATPAVAGNAAIIRQYFEDSAYWEATCNGAYSLCGGTFAPRGATVKAMLAHSGEPMGRYPGGAEEGSVTLDTTPDFLQGFGRIALPNVLPLSGTTVSGLDLFVDEMSMSTRQTKTYTVTVTGSGAPLKVTIAWMDPPASTSATKLLIHDIDLKVTAPNGDKYYGNEFAGDEENNMEQVTIPSPAAGTYVVVVTSKSITYDPTQKVSVVITSVGSVSGPATGSVTSTEANYPLLCAGGESQMTVVMTDKGTDGWGGGNTYQIIRTSDSAVVHSGALDASSKGNFFLKETFCLADDTYTAELSLTGSSKDDIGFSIYACDVFLNKDYLSQSFTVSSNACGACSENSIEITLQGSEYGVPYGWTGDSSYTITSYDAGVDIVGTLEVGIVDVRGFCLPDGQYNVTFDNVPSEDDWAGFPSSSYERFFGIEEYTMSFTCGGEDVTLRTYSCDNDDCTRVIQLAILQFSGGSCDVLLITSGDLSPSNDDDADDDKTTSMIIIVLVLAALVIIGFAVGLFLYNCCCASSTSKPPPKNRGVQMSGGGNHAAY